MKNKETMCDRFSVPCSSSRCHVIWFGLLEHAINSVGPMLLTNEAFCYYHTIVTNLWVGEYPNQI